MAAVTQTAFFKYIFLNENFGVLNKISLKYIPLGQFDNLAALVQIMAWRRSGHKPLSEPMVAKPFSEAMMEYCQLDPWEQTSVKF